MIYNYLKVGLRNILKHKTFSFINVSGLAAAMSVCMLIILMLADQKSYDQFNIKKDRIYRILADQPDFRHPYATTQFPLSDVLKSEDPAVADATHLVTGVGGDAVYDHTSQELVGYFAEPSFFKIFSFELAEGSADDALRQPNAVVLSAAAARRLFGAQDPVGKTISFSDRGLNFMGAGEASTSTPWGNFVVTGVVADKGYKSHLTFDALISESSMPGLVATKKIDDLRSDWQNLFRCYTYVLVQPGKSGQDLDNSLKSIASSHTKAFADMKGFSLKGQALTSISPGLILGNEPSFALPRVVYYFLSILALIIMFSACLNYVNLSVARSLTRAKEIGIRKTNGARRKNIVAQFLCESILMALFAFLMAMGFLFLLKAGFRGLWVNQYLHFQLEVGWQVYGVFIAFAFMIGLLSGLYPAFYLSRFHLVSVLKNFAGLRPGKLVMRKVLSVAQFSISLIFIITSLLIFNQSTHFLKFQYEFTHKNIVNIPLQGNDYKTVAKEMGTLPGVDAVSACQYVPVSGRSEGISIRRLGAKEDFTPMVSLPVDENFVSTLQLHMVAGRNLQSGPNKEKYVLLNEAAVKALGYKNANAAIGHSLALNGNDTSYLEVAGVLQNFHMNLDHDQVEPLVIQNQPALFRYLNIRIGASDPRSTVAALENKWKTLDPVHPFKFKFFDDQLAATSQAFFDAVTILGYMAFIAISIACLGMLGMATFTTERRVKEVGIRKTLGATVSQLVLLLSREFVVVLAIAILVAAPLSFILNNLWLSRFPNRVAFGLGTVISGILVLLIPGLATIFSQTARAARRNPVAALRTE